MKAVILAAGRGSRMGLLTEHKPKCMVEFQGKPLLAWQQQACSAAGIAKLGAVVGYAREAFEGMGLTLFENPRWESTNMVSSLASAQAWLSAEPCIVSYSDIFYEADAVRLLMNARSDIGVLYDVNWRTQWEERFDDPLSDAETFRIDASGAILEIGNRAATIDEIEGQYMGLLHFTPRGWRAVAGYCAALAPAVLDKLSMTELLNGLIGAGVTVLGVPYRGLWGEIDSASDLAAHETRIARLTPGGIFRAS